MSKGALYAVSLVKPPVLATRGGCWIDGPGFQVHLGVEPDFRPALKAHPGFRVRGVRTLADRLGAAGYLVTWSDDVLPCCVVAMDSCPPELTEALSAPPEPCVIAWAS